MDSFWVAVRVVVPMAIMMGIGILLRVGKIAERDTMKKVDKISFNLFLPMLMFSNTFDTDFSQISGGYILYGIGGSFLLFLIAIFVIPRFEKNPPSAAAMGNALIRANYMMYSTAIATNLYGDADLGVIMLLGAITIPFTNALSAIVLEVARSGKANARQLLLAIIKNPLVIAAAIGLTINFSGIQLPDIIVGVVDDIAGLATPLSFLSLGVSLNFESIAGNKKRLGAGPGLPRHGAVRPAGAVLRTSRGVQLSHGGGNGRGSGACRSDGHFPHHLLSDHHFYLGPGPQRRGAAVTGIFSFTCFSFDTFPGMG